MTSCVCVQKELVNLLLCGRAVSNVFDNELELDSGNGNTTLLKGIKGHCNIGLLSLFEHYNICKVSWVQIQFPNRYQLSGHLKGLSLTHLKDATVYILYD